MARGGGDSHTMRPPGRCCSCSTAVCEMPAESSAELLWVNTLRHAAGGGCSPGLRLWARRCLPGRAPGHQLGSQHLQEPVSSQGGGQDTSHCLLMAAQHRLHMQPVKLLPLAVACR